MALIDQQVSPYALIIVTFESDAHGHWLAAVVSECAFLVNVYSYNI